MGQLSPQVPMIRRGAELERTCVIKIDTIIMNRDLIFIEQQHASYYINIILILIGVLLY